MPVSTEYYAQLNKQQYCLKLGVDTYETEIYYQSKEVKVVDGKEFYPMLLRFTKNGKNLVAVIPAEVRKIVTKSWPLEFIDYRYDYDAMEKEAERIVRDA